MRGAMGKPTYLQQAVVDREVAFVMYAFERSGWGLMYLTRILTTQMCDRSFEAHVSCCMHVSNVMFACALAAGVHAAQGALCW